MNQPPSGPNTPGSNNPPDPYPQGTGNLPAPGGSQPPGGYPPPAPQGGYQPPPAGGYQQPGGFAPPTGPAPAAGRPSWLKWVLGCAGLVIVGCIAFFAITYFSVNGLLQPLTTTADNFMNT